MGTKEAKFYTIVIIVSIVVAVLLVYFVISLIKHQRLYVALATKNILAELSILEKDRMRTAADLHDELFPLLTAAKWQMDAIEGRNEEEKSSVTTSIQYIDTVAARLREIARDLMPVALSTYGLQAALEDFFSIVQKAARIKITFNYKVQSTFTDDQKINCYRIIQEITQNTIKHAAASQLLISINETKDVVKVICEDNGKGFNYDSMLQKSSGFGLKNIKNRADIISNNFTVLSVPGKGTQYSFDISLK